MTDEKAIYDVVIIGGGVCGTALLYSLSNYTNVGKIALIEKNADVALVNSKQSSNSQTLHFGDIETNYSLEKAAKVNRAAMMVQRYLLKYDAAQEIHTVYHKMVLAVGEQEATALKARYETFKTLFPKLRLIEKAEIAQLEPQVMAGRSADEAVLALSTPDGYAVDYQKLSQSFVKSAVESAVKASDQQIAVMLGCKVHSIQAQAEAAEETGGLYAIALTHQTSDQNGEQTGDQIAPPKTIFAKAVAVTSGAHSLLFAKAMGYGQDYALLSAAGSFYFAPALLKGKVYMMQMEKLPFAAIHGDPEVHDASQTRFGPTAKVLPMLERHQYGTVIEYFKTAGLSLDAFRSFFAILSDRTILWYIVINFIYDFPLIGKRLFIREVRKIIPAIKLSDLTFAKGYGGIRPQIVNLKSRQLEMGEAKILGKNILFNITPSPGASTCLKTAEDDTQRLVNFLGEAYRFDRERFSEDFG